MPLWSGDRLEHGSIGEPVAVRLCYSPRMDKDREKILRRMIKDLLVSTACYGNYVGDSVLVLNRLFTLEEIRTCIESLIPDSEIGR